MKAPKTYKIKKVRKDRESIIEGTLEYLKDYFSYTFEVGYSRNRKINKNPKTIDSFISNLEKSLDEKEGACYERTSIYLIN